jgi:hypothetical protein
MMLHCNKIPRTRFHPAGDSAWRRQHLRSTRMKAPKILPWVAHKTGISEELALKLWRRAAGEAQVMTGCCNSSAYYRLAVERFIDFAEAEGSRCVVRQKVGSRNCVSWLWRHQNRISKLNLITAENVVRLWQNNLSKLYGAQRHAV